MNQVFKSSDYPMLAYEEAWQIIARSLAPLAPVRLGLGSVHGLVLAEDVIAGDDMPPFAAAAMDGYAVIAADPSADRQVLGEQDAGVKLDLAVTPGTAVRIMTGAWLPAGADAVIPFEETIESAGRVYLQSPIKSGANVRPVGQDICAGEAAILKGAVLGPAEIGLLATLGRAEVLVIPRPRVFIMATGDELVPLGVEPQPGQIRDSNTLALLAAAGAAGVEAFSLPQPVGDDPSRLEQALGDGLSAADLVITSGGVSMGSRDLIKPLLAKLGEVLVGRVAIKPGKPLTFALVHGKPVFGLPGFPVSSLVCFEQFARPALRVLGGHRLLWRPRTRVKLAQTLRHDADRTEFQRAIVERSAHGLEAHSTGAQGSGRLKSLIGANALLVLPAGMGDFTAGSEVTALMISQPEAHEEL
jgi:molybdenum cofactor synthesis domain-containing protein